MNQIIELNVGGVHYTTTQDLLLKEKKSKLYEIFSNKQSMLKDAKGRYFIDRDGVLFRYILQYLRDKQLNLPEGFREKQLLYKEAEYYKLNGMLNNIKGDEKRGTFGYISVNYQRNSSLDLSAYGDKYVQLLICGRVGLCREVFSDLPIVNSIRRIPTEYTSISFRGYIEKIFDILHAKGFRLVQHYVEDNTNYTFIFLRE